MSGTATLIEALQSLSKKLTLAAVNEGTITRGEYELAESLTEWYTTKGKPLIAERARQRQTVTPVEIDEFKVSLKLEAGKWMWLVEGSDRQTRAGEERLLESAFSAAHRAALNMQKPT